MLLIFVLKTGSNCLCGPVGSYCRWTRVSSPSVGVCPNFMQGSVNFYQETAQHVLWQQRKGSKWLYFLLLGMRHKKAKGSLGGLRGVEQMYFPLQWLRKSQRLLAPFFLLYLFHLLQSVGLFYTPPPPPPHWTQRWLAPFLASGSLVIKLERGWILSLRLHPGPKFCDWEKPR